MWLPTQRLTRVFVVLCFRIECRVFSTVKARMEKQVLFVGGGERDMADK